MTVMEALCVMETQLARAATALQIAKAHGHDAKLVKDEQRILDRMIDDSGLLEKMLAGVIRRGRVSEG
jgi:hypothetical protein